MKESYENKGKRQKPDSWNLSQEVSKLNRQLRDIKEDIRLLVAFSLITMIATVCILVAVLLRLGA